MRPGLLHTPILLLVAFVTVSPVSLEAKEKEEVTGEGLDIRVTAEGRHGVGEGYRTSRGDWGQWGSWTGFGVGVESVGRIRSMDVRGRVLLPVRLETGNRAPTVEFSVARKGGGLAYGRHEERSTSMVARGASVKGLRGDFQIGQVGLQLLHGETRAAREGRVDPTTGTITSWGQYRRTLTNLNLSASPSRNWDVALSLVRGQDETGPIHHGAYREKNMVGGGEVKFRSGRSRLNASMGVSQTGRQPLLGPLSNRSGVAWEIEAQTKLVGHSIRAESYSVARDYTSFAGFSRPANRRGFGVSDRFSVFHRKVSLGLGYDQLSRDPSGVNTETERNPWTNIKIRPGGSLPEMNLRTELSRNSTDGSGSGDTFVRSSIRLSDTWKSGESFRISPQMRFEYSRRSTRTAGFEVKRTLSGGGEFEVGGCEAGAQLTWSVRDRGGSGPGYRQFSLDLRQKVVGGERFRLETRESYDTLAHEDSSRRSGIDLAARVFCEIVPGRVSVSGNYRYRSKRIQKIETDVQDSSGAFLAVTVTETVRVLGR